jgi:hypothetical protein
VGREQVKARWYRVTSVEKDVFEFLEKPEAVGRKFFL